MIFKNVFIVATSMLIAFCNLSAKNPKQLDPGGVSIDFSKVKPPEVTTSGPNLLQNGSFENVDVKGNPTKKGQWLRSWHVHTLDTSKGRALEKKADKFVITSTTTVNPVDGKRCAKIFTPNKINDMRWKKKQGIPMISNGFRYYVNLPKGSSSGKFNLSFMFRGKTPKEINGYNGLNVRIVPLGGNKIPWSCKSTGKAINKQLAMTRTWQRIDIPFIAPKDTEFFSLNLKLYGCGEVFLDDVQLRTVRMVNGVTIKMIPMSFLDNTFCLAKGNPAMVGFACKNEVGIKIKRPFLNVKLPVEVKVLGVRNPIKIVEKKEVIDNGKKYIQYKIDLRAYKNSIKKDSYSTYSMVALMLESDAKVGSKLPSFYQFIDGNYATPWQKFDLKIIPSIGKVTAPKRFKTAPVFGLDGSYSDPIAARKLAVLIRDAGFNSSHGPFSNIQSQELKKTKIERNNQPYFLCNGYRIGKKKKPKYALFKLADGTYRTKPREAICPVEVYTQGKYYRDTVIPMLRNLLVTEDLTDQIMTNWEPYMFNFKGCFCDRCKNEFIKYSGKPKAKIDKIWPSKIIVIYKDKWEKFRSWQHAKLVKTLEQTCQTIGKEAGKDSHFIPEINWSALTKGGRAKCAQNDPRDYMDSLPVIEPWGPYIYFDFTHPYIYNTGIHVITYEAGKNIKKYVAENVPNKKKRPALIAFPHGLQCNTLVTEPEALGFEMLCYFVNGWNGTFLYYMPGGYDARWWNAATEANQRIASYEKFIFDGKRINTAKIKAVSILPSLKLPLSAKGNFLQKIPSLMDAEIIEIVEYKLGNKRLIAVGNFWQKGEYFFKLTMPGLKVNAKYAVVQTIEKRIFTPNAKRLYFTGKELASGILLQVGALRWSFYIIEPYNVKTNYGVQLDQLFMSNSLKKSIPEIKKTLQWEKEYQRKINASAAKVAVLPDYSKLKAISNKGVSCKVIKHDSVPALEITGRLGKIILTPAKGAMVLSWTKNGSELVGSKMGGLCADAFWWPQSAVSVSVIESPYRLISQKKSIDGLNMIFERELTLVDSKSLKGTTLRKSYEFNSNGSFTVSTSIINTTKATIQFSYRRRSISAFMGTSDAKYGTATMDNIVFERSFVQKLYRYATKGDPDLEKSFNMDRIMITKSPSVIFSAPWIKPKAKFTVLDKDKLYCFVFWDYGSQKFSTFEQIFIKTVIASGKTWKTRTRWQLTK